MTKTEFVEAFILNYVSTYAAAKGAAAPMGHAPNAMPIPVDSAFDLAIKTWSKLQDFKGMMQDAYL